MRTDPAKFKNFVGILRQESALTCYTDTLINSRGEKCVRIQYMLSQFVCMVVVLLHSFCYSGVSKYEIWMITVLLAII